jgi:hypothetical protein
MLANTTKWRYGYYDKAGIWQRTKFCLVYCGPDRCDCCPPKLPEIYKSPIQEILTKEVNETNDSNS